MRDTVKDDILRLTNNGLDVFNFYLPYDLPMRKNFRSPFYEDQKASCSVFEGKDKIWRYKDFGDGGNHSGDCFWFVGELKGFNLGSDFPKILDAIICDLKLPLTSPLNQMTYYQPQYKRVSMSHEKDAVAAPPTVFPTVSSATATPDEYTFLKQEYSDEELNYWLHYGITKATLKLYKVYSIKSFSSYRRSDGKPYTISSNAQEPMFMYDQGTSAKVYRPFSDMRFLNAGVKHDGFAFGFEQLPLKGDVIFITGGEKDVLSLAVRGFSAISFNSETSGVDTTVIEMLQRRFKHILICYDMDNTGITASTRLVESLSTFRVLRMELPLAGTKAEKDVSDYFAKGNSRDDFQALVYQTRQKNLYQQTMALLKSCEIDLSNPPEESKAVVSINGTVIGSYDNLLCITGGEGTGKSNYVSGIISGAISQISLPVEETLGMEISCNEEGKAVIQYDTEQSDAQLYKNIKRTLKRAGLSETPPYYHSRCLTAFTRKERLRLIQDSMDMYYHQHDGIHLVVIDGVADLIRSANEEIESVAVVEELYRLAGIYNTCIVCVIHQTPNGQKLRGHLGSELQRKAAGILSIEKDKSNDAYSVVKALKVRDGDPLDIPMQLFGWDKKQNMHVYRGIKTMRETEERKHTELQEIAAEIMSEVRVMSLSDFTDKIAEWLLNTYDFKDKRTAQSRIAYMETSGIITVTEEGEVTLKGGQDE